MSEEAYDPPPEGEKREVVVHAVVNTDQLRQAVLRYVAEQKYDAAIKELRDFQKIKSIYPTYSTRTDRYYDHSEELILAIKSKRTFPNFALLPAAKQQELHERVVEHNEALKRLLSRLGSIDMELKLYDARSTVWVMQAFFLSLFVIMTLAVVREAWGTMYMPLIVVMEDLQDWFINLIGL